MPNKKKKGGSNSAYGQFMYSMKDRLGISFKEAEERFGHQWKTMSAEEKAMYQPNKTNVPVDSFGIPLSYHVEVEDQKKKLHQDMVSGVQSLVSMHKAGEALAQLEFVVFAVTDYVKTDEGKVFPAELSLVRATLGAGLHPKQYHAIINPPSVWPLGSEHLMRAKVAASHRLPTNRRSPDCVGTDDYELVAAEIVSFLTQDDGEVAPVYTMAEHVEDARLVLAAAFELEEVRVWEVEILLRDVFVTLNPSHLGIYTTEHARMDILNTPQTFDYHPKLGCKWHREEMPDEVNHCSLNMAQRWGYKLLEALKLDESLGIELITGRHTPGPNHIHGEVVQLSRQQQRRMNYRSREALLMSISGSSASLRPNGRESDSDTSSSTLNLSSHEPRRDRHSQASAAGGTAPDEAESVRAVAARTGRPISPWRTDFINRNDPVCATGDTTAFPSLGGGSSRRGASASSSSRGGGTSSRNKAGSELGANGGARPKIREHPCPQQQQQRGLPAASAPLPSRVHDTQPDAPVRQGPLQQQRDGGGKKRRQRLKKTNSILQLQQGMERVSLAAGDEQGEQHPSTTPILAAAGWGAPVRGIGSSTSRQEQRELGEQEQDLAFPSLHPSSVGRGRKRK